MTYRFRRWAPRLGFAAIDAIGGALRRSLAWSSAFRASPVPTAPSRILVLRLDHIGDILLSTPALAALRQLHPSAKLTVLCGSWSAPVLESSALVDEVLVFDAPWFDRSGRPGPGTLRAIWTEARALRARSFDLALDLRGDARHVLLARLAGIPCSVGYGDTGLGFLLDRVVERRAVHEVERALDVVRALGPLPGPASRPDVRVTEAARERVRILLSERGLDEPTGPLVLLHPGAGTLAKQWPPASWRSLALALQRQLGGRIVVGGSWGERALAQSIVEVLEAPAANLAGALGLAELPALIEIADLVISVDSAPMHMAWALSRPLVAVFSATVGLEEFGPLGPTSRALQSPVPCLGCRLEICPLPTSCMDLLEPDAVLAAAMALLSG